MPEKMSPEQTERVQAFHDWIKAPMPMVSLIKTFEISRLVQACRKKKLKLNAALCWCIGKAASKEKLFYDLPFADHILRFDQLAISVVVKTESGSITTCDIPFTDDFSLFYQEYVSRTKEAARTGILQDLSSEYMVIGTSALTSCRLDGIVNIYAGVFNNPFLSWGKIQKKGFRYLLPISFQFHHSQMDGMEAADFLNRLDREFRTFR